MRKTLYKGKNTKKPPKLPSILRMAPQTTKAWIPAPQITWPLYFGPIRQIRPSNWTETESRASHVTHFSKKPEFTPLPTDWNSEHGLRSFNSLTEKIRNKNMVYYDYAIQ